MPKWILFLAEKPVFGNEEKANQWRSFLDRSRAALQQVQVSQPLPEGAWQWQLGTGLPSLSRLVLLCEELLIPYRVLFFDEWVEGRLAEKTRISLGGERFP